MDGVISAEQLSRLIGLVYDAAVDPARWPVAMEAIRVDLDFHNATLNLQAMPSGQVLVNVTSNVPAAFLALMPGAGPDVVEQWGGEQVLGALPFHEPAILTRVNSRFRPETTTNRYYLEFAKPQGLIDVLAIGLMRDARGLGSLAFGRHRGMGPIGEREVAVARLLIPHLQRAATINRLLETAAVARTTFEAALDTLTVPVVLTDAELRIVHANPPARPADAGPR